MVTITGGNKLDAALSRIARQVAKPAKLQVGFMAGSTTPSGVSIPLIAALNEFGVPARGQPPRPFFRSMIAKESPRWGELIAVLLKRHDYDAAAALGAAGTIIEEQLRQSIIELTSPPLAASTIARKGSDKPLIHHGDMLNSVASRVEE